jgi:hypothetical protein
MSRLIRRANGTAPVFHLTALMSQNATSKPRPGGRRKRPWVFTEQGVAMLSSVLRSPTAVNVNIEIMRTFVRLRRLMATPGELVEQLTKLPEAVAVTRDSSRGGGGRPRGYPGRDREMNLALRRRPPVAEAKNPFSPAMQNAIIGVTIRWRVRLPMERGGCVPNRPNRSSRSSRRRRLNAMSKLKRFRYSTRTLFIGITLVAILCGLFGLRSVHSMRDRQVAIEQAVGFP